MTNEECFEAWAPEGIHWSRWAKPALFAGLANVGARAGAENWSVHDVSWTPEPRGKTAIVVDLPGAESVVVGLALARRGYRPVPVYNTSVGPSAVIDVEPLARFLDAGAEALREIRLPADAPPAFLLDADRMAPGKPLVPGRYDNRWIVFPQDFPSANYLLSQGIAEVLLLQTGQGEPREDLAHVLLRWQDAGIQLRAADVATGGQPRELRVSPPSLFRRAWYRAAALMGLRRNSAGGFGAVIPIPSSGG